MRVGEARVHIDPSMTQELARAGRRMGELLDQGVAAATLSVLRGDAVPVEEVQAELGPPAYAALVACGLFEPTAGGAVGSAFRGHRIDGGLVFSDPDAEEDEQDPFYLDPLWEAELLIRLMLPRRGERALDVGCGCGVLSVALAPHYSQVVGVDVNPRALEMSRLNAALNDVSNAEFVSSDMYEAIEGRFDRIVFNSPTNEEADQFRDLLEAGEGILEGFFTGLPEHLAPGGLVEVNLAMNDYPHSRFVDRLRTWLARSGSGIDITILVSQRMPGEPGQEWKRGWLVGTTGQGRITELDWPYHEVSEDGVAPLGPAVQRLLTEAPAG